MIDETKKKHAHRRLMKNIEFEEEFKENYLFNYLKIFIAEVCLHAN